MRRNRLIWLAIWILSLIIISFFGGPVSYGFFMVITLIPVIALLYLLCVYVLFHIYQRIDSKWLVANQTIPFYFTLMNDYFFMFSGIKVKFYSSFSSIGGLDENTEYELFPNTGITKETSLVCKYRGEYEVGIKNVIIQDFFRLFCFSYHNREPLRVTVKPRVVYLEGLKSVDINSAVRETETNSTELDVLVRKYVPGDDMRQVHWGVSAKSGNLMLRKRIGEEQQGVGILLSTHRCSRDQFEYLPIENKMLETALAVAIYFINEGTSIVHFHRTEKMEMRHLGRLEQFDEYYEFVSRVVFTEDKGDELSFFEVSHNNVLFECKAVFMIVHEWCEATIKMMQLLNENGVYTVVCIVNNEVDKESIANKFSRTEIINISPEDDLTEVL